MSVCLSLFTDLYVAWMFAQTFNHVSYLHIFFSIYSICASAKVITEPFPKQQILESTKSKEFADDNFRFNENGRKLSKQLKKTLREKEKVLVTSNFSFSHSVFKSLVQQTRKNQGLFGKGLSYFQCQRLSSLYTIIFCW